MKKRFLAILLTICMVLSMAPAALAAETDPFTDVNSADWYYDEVQYVYENDLMKGTSDTTFSPDTTVSRAMIVTILYRLEGQPTVSTAGTFTDVAAGQYYTEAVEWGYANQIIGGYGSGLFGPSDPLTREQMAAILYRYAQYKEYDVSDSADLSGYTDVGTVSAYALDAFAWANANGLVKGTSATTLSPKGSATRAQFAVILCRFCVNVVADVADADTTEEYTVTFEYNYGSKGTYKTVTVEDGETVDKPANPTRGGYSFSGWYTKATGGEKFDFDTEIIKDTTLYAQWTKTSSNSGGGGSSHSHRYSNEWSYNAETHWHDATCGHNVKSGEAVHSPGNTGLCICGCYVAPENATQVTSFEELKAALANGGAIQVMNDIAISETLNAGAETTIYGYGNTLTYADGFVGTMLNASAKTTIYNLNMDGGGKPSENEFYAVYTSANTTLCGLTIENFVATKIVKTEHNTPGLTLTDVDVKNNTLVGRESGDQRACVFWLQGTSPVVFTNVTITGNTVPADYNNAGSGVILYFRNSGTNFDGTNVVIENNKVGNHIVASYSSLAKNTYNFHSGSIKDNVGGNIFVVGKLTFGDDMYVGSNITITNDSSSNVSVLTNNGYIKGDISSNSQAWGRGETIYTGTGTVEGEIENLKCVDKDGTELIYSASQLKAFAEAINNSDTYAYKTVKLMADIDLTGDTWTSVNVDGYHGAGVVTVEGGGHTITGLDAPLFAGGFAGNSGIVIKDLTLDKANMTDTSNGATGFGAFISSIDSMPTIELKNCKLTNSTITSTTGSRVGGLIGWTAGYDIQDNGPVDTKVTIQNCEVSNCIITAKGSVGTIIGHAGNNPATYHNITNCTVKNNKLTSTDDGGWRVGVVVGTANVGEVTISGTDYSGNTLAQIDKTAPDHSDLYGRFVPGTTGKLTIDGVTMLANGVSYGYDADKKTYSVSDAASLNYVIENMNAANITLAAGTYTMPASAQGKTLTISGTKDTVISVETIDTNAGGASVTFEGVTVQGQTSGDFGGWGNGAKINMKDCTIAGKITLYGDATFTNCTFTNKNDYAVWTWGATAVEFTNCTFESGGKALLVYGNGGNKTATVNINSCTFTDDGTLSGKAAIETGNDYDFTYTIKINNTTVTGFDVNTAGISTNTNVWANKNSMDKDHLNVVIDGVDVY